QSQLLGDQCKYWEKSTCPGKEEPLHVNPAETLDTIRQHAKDKESITNRTAVGQDGSGGSGAGAVLDLFAAGEGAAGGPGVARQVLKCQ
ncbi:hypothetical protein Tco_1010872, partial [Tanacetum coccineum]